MSVRGKRTLGSRVAGSCLVMRKKEELNGNNSRVLKVEGGKQRSFMSGERVSRLTINRLGGCGPASLAKKKRHSTTVGAWGGIKGIRNGTDGKNRNRGIKKKRYILSLKIHLHEGRSVA